jgi:hypothetical protein
MKQENTPFLSFWQHHGSLAAKGIVFAGTGSI